MLPTDNSLKINALKWRVIRFVCFVTWSAKKKHVLYEVPANKLLLYENYCCTCWPVDHRQLEPSLGLLDMTGCPGSVITVLMLSPSKVQYCDNWRMAANLTLTQQIRACLEGQRQRKGRMKPPWLDDLEVIDGISQSVFYLQRYWIYHCGALNEDNI